MSIGTVILPVVTKEEELKFMSQGVFVVSRYESSLLSEILPIKVQPETLDLDIEGANAPPTGAVTLGLFASVSVGRRAYGVKARSVSIRWTTAAPPGYKVGGTLRVPIMTESSFDRIQVGDVGGYAGVGVQVTAKQPESVR